MKRVYVSVEYFPACEMAGSDPFWLVDVRDCETASPVHADTLFAYAHVERDISARTAQIRRQVAKYHPEMQVVAGVTNPL